MTYKDPQDLASAATFSLRQHHKQMVSDLSMRLFKSRSQIVQDAIEAYFTANGGTLAQAPDAHLEAQYDDRTDQD